MEETVTHTVSVVQERVNQGVAYLDANYPGWLEMIDVDTLDISCPLCCTLGQVAGSYEQGLKRLGSNGGTLLGFDGSDLLINGELTEAWKETVLRLRAERTGGVLIHAA